MAERKTVHMDVDTGVDDALAIMMALNLGEVRLVGISTVAGNTSARQAAVNTAFVLERLGVGDVPIHVGNERTCDGKLVAPARNVHGTDGLGGIVGAWEPRADRLAAGSVEAILRAAREYGEELHLVLTGPVTNLAVAMEVDWQAISRVGEIVVMGGSIREGGNVTPAAEFNAKSDPQALQRVLGSGLAVKLIPLDVTHRVRLLGTDLQGGRALETGVRAFMAKLTDVYRRFYQGKTGVDACYLHDPLTVATVARRGLFGFERMRVSVVTEGTEAGRTVGVDDADAKVEVAMAVDAEGCLELFWGALGRASIDGES
jgi:inosine-uridine nucleoside N-ribohydrolase